MSFKTKDLEIIYNLRWKNVREDKKQMSIVAVYDIPATTLNFEVFKSYLLKNSGIAENDVNVYYIMENGKEYPIQSQTDFQVALYAFRRKARVGEIINLLLERISNQAARKVHKSNDVETQFDLKPTSILSNCCAGDTAPEWFVAGLAQLKKELKEEISANVSTVIAQAVADLKSYCPYKVKSKVEKRPKKIVSHGLGAVSDTKTLLRSLKYETKLDKLERKLTKYREKRLALQPGEGVAGCSDALKLNIIKAKERMVEEQKRKIEEDGDKSDEEITMDAKPVNIQSTIPHMLGGEQHIHQWLVENTGQDQWTSLTSLEYTWGSKSLVALKKSISVPFLKPGEKGTISVALYIPEEPGQYECYWQFMHKGRRFGHWLGAQFIVDPIRIDDKENAVQFKTSETRNSAEALKPYYDSMDEITKQQEEIFKRASDELAAFLLTEDEEPAKHSFTSTPDDSDCSWTSETPLRLFSKDALKEDIVNVPIPQCFIVPEKAEPVASTSAPKKDDNFDDNNNAESLASGSTIKITDDELDNMVLITLPKDEHVKSGYINVHVDGQKVLIPVNLLNSELVDAAQKLVESKSPSPPKDEPPMPKTLEEPIIPVQVINNDNNVAVDLTTPAKNVPEPEDYVEQRSNYFEANNYMSHCSAAGSCFSEVNASIDQQQRMFVFPQANPGYEVVYPVLDLNNSEEATLINKPIVPPADVRQRPAVNPFVEAVPNFQQTLPGMRRAPVGDATQPTLIATLIGMRPGVGTFDNVGRNTQEVPQPARAVPAQEATATLIGMRPGVGANTQEVPQPARAVPAQEATAPAAAAQVHILPESLVNGAVNVASSAINTARSVINMIRPQSPGGWANSHLPTATPQTPREANLQALAEMGFWSRDLNADLLERFNDDLTRVVAELVQ